MKAFAVVLVIAAAGSAHANSKADVLFKQGKKLLAQKKYADACAAFENSNKLDPQIGTELNTARCYEEWGKLATALRHYGDAETMAREAHDSRVAKIHVFVTKLDSQVPRLTLRAPDGADLTALEITLDGAKLDKSQLGEVQLVDPGPHSIEYRAGDAAKKTKVIPLERGGTSEITLDIPKPVAKPDKPPEATPVTHEATKPDAVAAVHVEVDSQPGHGRRVTGVVVGSAGVVAMGVAGYLTYSARSTYNDALAAHCGGSKTGCDADGLTITHDARSKANLATIVVGAGAAITALGVILYVTAPSTQPRGEHSLRVTPSGGPGAIGVVLDGRF
jgi:hypothetical protein